MLLEDYWSLTLFGPVALNSPKNVPTFQSKSKVYFILSQVHLLKCVCLNVVMLCHKCLVNETKNKVMHGCQLHCTHLFRNFHFFHLRDYKK